ncbi:hypothetical protein J7412_12750 [Shimia sp. R9_3]|nr:hypothetical protein [Shimia sp. R9_3]
MSTHSETVISPVVLPHDESAARSRKLLVTLTVVATLIVIFTALMIALDSPSGSTVSQDPKPINGITVFAILVLAGFSSAVVGGFFGFMFGMPRAFSRPTLTNDTGDRNGETSQASSDWTNNNLVEVSDWLTKIVVGLTLVNLNHLVGLIEAWGLAVGSAAGMDGTTGKVIGVSLLLANFCYGFVGIYVLARTRLSTLMARNYQKIQATLEKEVSSLRSSQAELQANLNTTISDISNPTSATSIMLALYRPKPNGFKEAIEQGEEALNHMDGEEAARVNGYLACAYGQKFGFEKQGGADAVTLAQIGDKAYEAARRMLHLDPTRKAWLRALFDESDPGFTKGENDLVPLYQDPTQQERFAQLLK